MAQAIITGRRRPSRTPFPTARDLATILFRQRRIFFWSFLLIFLGFTFYGFLARSYTAEMGVFLRRGRIDVPISAESAAAPSRYEITDEEMNSEAELLRDNDTLRKVVFATHLDAKLGWNIWGESSEALIQRATKRLATHLQVEPVRKTRVLNVKYKSSDPKLAAAVLKSLAGIYVEKHLAMHRPSGELAFFAKQADQYGTQLAAAETELLHLNDKGLVQPALQRDMVLQKLADAAASHEQILVSIAETQERIKALRSQLVTLPERDITEIRTSGNAQLLEKLKSSLLMLQLRRTELLTRFQPDYRLVQEVNEEIQQAQAAIAAEAEAPVRDETSAPNLQRQWAQSELEKAEVELTALQGRASASGTLIASYQATAKQLGHATIAQQVLLRESKVNEDSYLASVHKREEARMSDALDEHRILNATISQEPIVPAFPERSPLVFAGVGLLAAMVGSTVISMASDAADGTIRTPDEAKAYLGAPVLAWLPAEGCCIEPQRGPVA